MRWGPPGRMVDSQLNFLTVDLTHRLSPRGVTFDVSTNAKRMTIVLERKALVPLLIDLPQPTGMVMSVVSHRTSSVQPSPHSGSFPWQPAAVEPNDSDSRSTDNWAAQFRNVPKPLDRIFSKTTKSPALLKMSARTFPQFSAWENPPAVSVRGDRGSDRLLLKKGRRSHPKPTTKEAWHLRWFSFFWFYLRW